MPETSAVFDVVEFCHRTIAQPIQLDWHHYHRHHHLRFDRDTGQTSFREEVNRILARQGLVFELRADGRVVRLGPEPVRTLLTAPVFVTGDDTLDAMLVAGTGHQAAAFHSGIDQLYRRGK